MIRTVTEWQYDGQSKRGIVSGTDLTAAYVAPIVKSRCYGAILIPDEGAFLLGGKPKKEILLTPGTAAQLLADQMEEILAPESESESQKGT